MVKRFTSLCVLPVFCAALPCAALATPVLHRVVHIISFQTVRPILLTEGFLGYKSIILNATLERSSRTGE